MKDIFRIFANDIRSVSKQFFAVAIALAISILPALYAWVNIYANGNPYVNTGNIRIAVASNDKGITLDSGEHVNMADEVFYELKESKSIGWQFPESSDEAIEGVKSGKYYAAIVFEDNFTYNMYHFEQALVDDREPLTFYENAKKNAVAAKISETAASTLQESINTKYLETVFKVVFEETDQLSDELQSDTDNTADSIIGQLTQFRNTLDSYSRSIDAFIGNSTNVKSSINSAENNLTANRSASKKDLSNARSNLARAQKTIGKLKKTLDSRMDKLDTRLDKLEKVIGNLQGVDPLTPEDAKTAADQINDIVTELENLRAMLPDDGSISGADTLIATIDTMIEKLSDIRDGIDGMPDRVQEFLAAIDTVRTLQNDTLRPGFDEMLNNMDKTVEMMGPFVSSVSVMLDDIYPVLDATDDTVDSMDRSLLQLQKVLNSASDNIGDIIDKVNAADEDEKLQLLKDLLNGDPELYGKFFSSLVEVKTEEIYQVASYGAAMAPFYSVLAVWVGGVILVSILKTNADRKKFPGLSEAKYFFGRFLIFFLIGQIQAAVIVAGDIFLLDCQPVHPWLMWLSAAVTSLVFVMLIYALTLSFGDIGKAIVVVIMVVQIAGSSGSYPIEILPVIFSKIYRFFPFPYAINAMREALCGMYGYDYLLYLGGLLVFGVLGIVIGLVVRRPFIGMTKFVSEKLEETEVL